MSCFSFFESFPIDLDAPRRRFLRGLPAVAEPIVFAKIRFFFGTEHFVRKKASARERSPGAGLRRHSPFPARFFQEAGAESDRRKTPRPNFRRGVSCHGFPGALRARSRSYPTYVGSMAVDPFDARAGRGAAQDHAAELVQLVGAALLHAQLEKRRHDAVGEDLRMDLF